MDESFRMDLCVTFIFAEKILVNLLPARLPSMDSEISRLQQAKLLNRSKKGMCHSLMACITL